MALTDIFKKVGSKLKSNLEQTSKKFSLDPVKRVEALGNERLQSLDPTNPQNIADANKAFREGLVPGGTGAVKNLGPKTSQKVLPKILPTIKNLFKKPAPKTTRPSSKPGPQSKPPTQSFPQSFPKNIKNIRSAKPTVGNVGTSVAAGLGAGSFIDQSRGARPDLPQFPPGPQSIPPEGGDGPQSIPPDRGGPPPSDGPILGGKRGGPKPIVDPLTGQTVFSEAALASPGGGGGSFTPNIPPGFGGSFGGGGSEYTGLLDSIGVMGQGDTPLGEDEKKRSKIRDLDLGTIGLVPGVFDRIGRAAGLPAPGKFEVQPPPEVADIGDIQASKESTRSILDTGSAVSQDDLGETMNRLDTEAQNKTEELLETDPLPPDPREDSEEEVARIIEIEEENPGSSGRIQEDLDNFKAELGQPGLLNERHVLQKSLQGIQEIMEREIEDIRSNPDLPAGLAKRRLEALNERYGKSIQSLINQITLTQQRLDDIDDAVKERLGIQTLEFNRQQQTKDNNFRNLNLMISSGAIGGMSDVDIQQWSDATGVPQSVLESARESANAVDPEEALKLKKLENDILLQQKKLNGEGPSNTLEAILANPFLFNTLPPSTKEGLLGPLQEAGFRFPRQLSATQQEAQANAVSALGTLNRLEDLVLDEDGTVNKSALFAAGTGFGETAFNRNELIDLISRMRTGAALTTSEEKFYQAQVPRLRDDAATIESKITHWRALFSGLAGADLIIRTGEGEVVRATDMFDTQTRLQVRNLIDAGGTILETQ